MFKRRISLLLTVLMLMLLPVSQVNAKDKKDKDQKKISIEYSYLNEKNNMVEIQGIIENISKDKNKAEVTISNYKNDKDEEVKFSVNNGTKITYKNSNKYISLNNLGKGMKIKVYFPPSIIKGKPSVWQAKEIIIEEYEDEDEIRLETLEGEVIHITKYNDGIKALIKYREENQSVFSQINLVINEDTDILLKENYEEDEIEFQDINIGMKIKAYYGPGVTKSIPPMSYAKKVIILDEYKDELKKVQCKIIDVFNFEDGVIAYVEENNNKVLVFIGSKTEILNENKKILETDDIIKGREIEIYYRSNEGILNPNKYLPNMYVPEKIVILDAYEDITGTEGKVTSIYKGSTYTKVIVDGKKLDSHGYDKVNLVINKDTEIINVADGLKLHFDDISKDFYIIAYYDYKNTKAYPSVGVAEKIIVIEKDNKDLASTIGNIKEIYDVGGNNPIIYVEGSNATSYGYDKINLVIEEDTKIININGDNLSIKELKDNIRIKAYYEKDVTRSTPPIGKAKVILVY